MTPGPVSVIPGGSCLGPGRPASSSGRLGCSCRAVAAMGWTLGLGTLECWKLERPVSSHKNKRNHLSQFQAHLSILQVAHVALLISQGMFFVFLHFILLV